MNKSIATNLTLSLAALFLLVGNQATAQQDATAPQAASQPTAPTIVELLEMVEQDRVAESEDYRQRIQEFQQSVNRRQELLNVVRQRISTEETTSERLTETFQANEIILRNKQEILRDRRGDLNELFGTVQGVAGDFLNTFQSSLISAQYPERIPLLDEFIDKAGSTTDQVNIEELEQFWHTMMQEIVESGRVVSYNGDVALPNGDTVNRNIIRIGAYNSASDGEYLSYSANIGHLQMLPRQPDGGVRSSARDLQGASDGFTKTGIDPTGGVGGQVMANLVNFPTVGEQVRNNSGIIGFIIIAVGIVGVGLAFYRLTILMLVSVQVRNQLRSNKPSKNNPLGRVLQVAEANPGADTETLELKLGEAILQETPQLEKLLTIIKMIATIAPLGGLLGTVTGMIQVFQQITVYGAGDPTIMAGGISQALMTTVLGIVVAIPTIFMHTVVKSRSDEIIHILEEQATGMIAAKAERGD
ncbi:MAG: MotA/TolQ/ExbB proton channel family protein [Pseudohongiellaceae bacterium]